MRIEIEKSASSESKEGAWFTQLVIVIYIVRYAKRVPEGSPTELLSVATKPKLKT